MNVNLKKVFSILYATLVPISYSLIIGVFTALGVFVLYALGEHHPVSCLLSSYIICSVFSVASYIAFSRECISHVSGGKK